MKNNNFQLYTFIILSFVFFIPGCELKFQASRALLIENTSERPGYGLYSYILLSKASDPINNDKYLALIESYLNKIPETEKTEHYISRKQINIIYLPLTAESPNGFKNFNIQQKCNWILDNYDFVRAGYYLSKFTDEQIGNGPYIVSYMKPLSSDSAITNKYLIQDLSYVHPRIVSLWVDEFLKQSSKTKYWDKENLNKFADVLRNSIAIGADGLKEVSESLEWWKKSVNNWIAIK